MKKIFKIFFKILFILLIVLFIRFYNPMIDYINRPKVNVSIDENGSMRIEYKVYRLANFDSEEKDYTFSYTITDESLIKRIRNEFDNKNLIDYTDGLLLSVTDKYKIYLDENTSFYFDNSNGYCVLNSNEKSSLVKISSKIQSEIVSLLEEDFCKRNDLKNNYEIDDLEIYEYKENFVSTYKIDDKEKINGFIEICKGLEFSKIEKMEDLYKDLLYEVLLNSDNTIYIYKDFSKGIIEVATITVNEEITNAYYEIQIPEKFKTYLEKEKTNSKVEILECHIEDEGETYETKSINISDGYNTTAETTTIPRRIVISINEENMTANGMELIIRLYNYNKFERAMKNDFIIYKENGEKWEKLNAKVEPDETIINKNSKKIIENIDWTEKYGKLEKGKYKLERNIKINEKENLYYVIFEIK